MVPQSEAIVRLQNRNNLTVEQAESRIAAQNNNQSYITNANVVFSSLWPFKYTQSHIDKAWSLLQERIIS